MAEEMVGFNLIKDMTQEELIDEIIHQHYKLYRKESIHNLQHAVMQVRLMNYKERLEKEAELNCDGQHGFDIGNAL
jgi:hypothetical protein